jgi:hypothetical protein
MGLSTNSPTWWQFLANSSEAFGSIELIIRSLAIALGGGWAFWRFVLNRERFPRLTLKHQVDFWESEKSEWLVRVTLHMENTSKVMVRVFDGHTWVQQVTPAPRSAVMKFKEESRNPERAPYIVCWDKLGEKLHQGERELEPGEFDDVPMDFFVNKSYKRVLIYSFIENSTKPGRHIGWNTSTILDFGNSTGEAPNKGQPRDDVKPKPEAGKAHT